MAINFDYFRPGRPVSPHGSGFLHPASALIAILLAVSLPAAAQYVGKVPESTQKNGPDLRAVGVLEWTGDPGHPKASRLVPLTLWDGQDLQDASIYMAQPAPLALQSDVEYKLKKDGKTIGYYVINGAAQSQGTWVGVGAWKPLTVPKPAEPAKQVAAVSDEDSDHPVLHRAKHADNSGGNSTASEPPPDPDRPVLREPPKETKNPDAAKPGTDVAYSQPIANVPDPDRPHLFRGKPENEGSPVLPSLAGLPPDMHQTIAVSDAGNHPDHLWNYSWANPEDEVKLRTDLEDLARKALAPAPPAASAKPPVRRRTAARHGKAAPAPPPMALQDEQFHVFQLTYGGPATLIFSAHTEGPGAQEKFITLIAQPDLYGNAMVLFKNITDAADLDENPAMHLVDPVDAMADNRGELLFELRGASQREFALYRIVGGRVEKLFTSTPEAVVMPPIASPASPGSTPQ
jgi:hypothetical protein